MSQERKGIEHWKRGTFCPTPDKLNFYSKQLAQNFVDRSRNGQKYGHSLHIYKCPCGCFHLSTMSKDRHTKMLKTYQPPALKHQKEFAALLKP